MQHHFTVFVDESGDEGFTFHPPPDKGSSDWFVVSAVVTFSSQQDAILEAGRSIRKALGRPEKWAIHFADMNHGQRVRAISDLSDLKAKIINVAVDKRAIRDVQTFTDGKFRLYFYALRLLLERVSWLCRDTARKNRFPSPVARVIFEHRRRLDHNDLVSYFRLLRNVTQADAWLAANSADIRVHWDAFREPYLESAQKHQYTGLQFADLAASGIRTALEADRYGFTEHRFAKTLSKSFYCRGSNYLSYGMKFFPNAPDSTNDFMHWVNKHCGE